jgi:NAD(P)-dependent dehydrogenase (short-subunit alcohol dehydrogenase family)
MIHGPLDGRRCTAAHSAGSNYSAEDEARAMKSIGLGRLGTAREVAAAVAFLVSDEAA